MPRDTPWDGKPDTVPSPRPHRIGSAATAGFPLLAFDDARPRLDDGYLVKHLLGSTAMAVVYGEAGTGKTFFALYLGLLIAAGMEFFGRRVRRAGVIYVAAEAGRTIANRIAAAKHEIEFPETMPFAAITSPIDLCSNETDLDRLIAAIRAANLGMPVGLVIIDTLSRVMAGGNENSPDSMGALVRNIDRLRAETGAAVVLVHHTGKDTARGARGHSLLRAATDTEIEIARDDASKISTGRVTKQRDYATEGALSFSLRLVDLGADQDGDTVTSCVVEEEEAAPERRREKRLSPAEARALQMLAEAIETGGELPPANNHIPPAMRCTSESVWREYCYRGSISKSDSPDAKRMAFNRAAEALLAAGRIGKWEPWIWLA
jgi:hypothetical protein